MEFQPTSGYIDAISRNSSNTHAVPDDDDKSIDSIVGIHHANSTTFIKKRIIYTVTSTYIVQDVM